MPKTGATGMAASTNDAAACGGPVPPADTPLLWRP